VFALEFSATEWESAGKMWAIVSADDRDGAAGVVDDTVANGSEDPANEAAEAAGADY
jgi:hypothetical protein